MKQNSIAMEYRRLGKAGVQVSALSFGSWVTFGNQVNNEVARQCIVHAYENGINFFDNAEVYAKGQSEIVMGEILHKMAWSRDSYLVSSKVFWGGDKPNQNGLSRKHVTEACHAALKRLQLDYLDFYFCHRPDRNTPMEETVWAMHNLVQQGKVLYWGTSEWSAQEIQEAIMVARVNHLVPPTMEQPQYNMFVRHKVEIEYRKLLEEYGYGTTTWSPLSSGILSGKYNDGMPEGARLGMGDMQRLKERLLTPANIEKVKQIALVAADLGTSAACLAIAWCLKNPHVSTVITGATKVEQLRQNLQALEVLPKLDDAVMERISAVIGTTPAVPV